MGYIKLFESFDTLEELSTLFDEYFLKDFEIEQVGKKYYVRFHKYINTFHSFERLKNYLRLKKYVYGYSDLKEFKKVLNLRPANIFEDDNWLIKNLIYFNRIEDVTLMMGMKGILKSNFAPNPNDKEELLSKCKTKEMYGLIKYNL